VTAENYEVYHGKYYIVYSAEEHLLDGDTPLMYDLALHGPVELREDSIKGDVEAPDWPSLVTFAA
jgi:hypothetical protein